MNILIIDDEKQLAEALVEILKHNKFSADAAYDGAEGLAYVLTGNYDLVILDIMLPKKNGLEVIKEIRKHNFSVPVLMLSAKSEISDKITGLDLGADDYLTKPFSGEELLARIRALTRRKSEFLGDFLTFMDLTLNKNTFELSCKDKKVKLGLKEFMVLEILLSNPSHIVSKEKLIEKVWGYDFEGEYNTAEVYISFLRKKFSAIHSTLEIKAVRGVGYCLEKRL